MLISVRKTDIFNISCLTFFKLKNIFELQAIYCLLKKSIKMNDDGTFRFRDSNSSKNHNDKS